MFRFTQGLYFFVLMSLCMATASTAARLPMDHQVSTPRLTVGKDAG